MNDLNTQQFDSFILGTLNDAERADFEKQIAQNPASAAQLRLHQAEHRAVEMAVQQDLRAQMAVWKAEQEQAENEAKQHRDTMRVSFSRRQIFRYAAAAAVLLVAAVLVFMPRPSNPDELFDQSRSSFRGGDEQGFGAEVGDIVSLMDAKKYSEALPEFEKLPADVKNPQKIALLKADCLYHLGRLDEAEGIFRNAIAAPSSARNGQKAEWGLLLTLLKKGNKTEAKTLLDKILNSPGHGFLNAAREIVI